MDKVSDFFKDLKERISSPLISSFIVAWIVFNWKIVIALLKFEVKGFSLKDYLSYVDYISSLINKCDSFWNPLLVGLFYSFIYPFIRNGIKITDAWFKSWGNVLTLRASKSNMVSIEKYINLRDTYKKRSDFLESVIDEETKTIQKNEDLVNENNELKFHINQKSKEVNQQNEELLKLQNENNLKSNKISSLEIQLSKLTTNKENEKNRSLVETLNGFWYITRHRKNHSEDVFPFEKIRISNGTVFQLDEIGIESNYFKITEYQYFPESSNIHISTNQLTSSGKISFSLIPNEEFTILTGKESNNPLTTVTFTKVNSLEELKSK